ncbi:MAG TPA: DUF4129 domain-containing protein [Puia sp.]|nr:DUF4129 domain-containing protein [Puia sp.]
MNRVFLIFLLIISHAVDAQDEKKTSDSTVVSDTIVSRFKQINDQLHSSAEDTATDTKATIEDSVVLRNIPDSVSSNLGRNKDFAYANDPEYWIQAPVHRQKNLPDYLFEWISSIWFRGFVFAFLISILLYALYKIIVQNRLYMFYSSPKKNIIEGADETKSAFDNIDQKIRDAVSLNDFRSALRYLYLKTLKIAGEEKLIVFQAQGTNAAYIQQLLNHPLQNQFRFLTHAYEYVWYGGFELKQEQFESLQKQFGDFYKAMNH